MELGEFRCDSSCNGSRRQHTDEDCEPGYMRCTGCNDKRVRMGAATQIVLRVQVMGSLTMAMLEKATELARVLGADDEVLMTREGNSIHHFEIAAESITQRLEIQNLLRQERDARERNGLGARR